MLFDSSYSWGSSPFPAQPPRKLTPLEGPWGIGMRLRNVDVYALSCLCEYRNLSALAFSCLQPKLLFVSLSSFMLIAFHLWAFLADFVPWWTWCRRGELQYILGLSYWNRRIKGKKTVFILKNYSDLNIFARSNIKPDLEILILFYSYFHPLLLSLLNRQIIFLFKKDSRVSSVIHYWF